jgi:nitrogen fixation-related uncharacterized protein
MIYLIIIIIILVLLGLIVYYYGKKDNYFDNSYENQDLNNITNNKNIDLKETFSNDINYNTNITNVFSNRLIDSSKKFVSNSYHQQKEYNMNEIREKHPINSLNMETSIFKENNSNDMCTPKYNNDENKGIDSGIKDCIKNCDGECLEFGVTGNALCFLRDLTKCPIKSTPN